MVSLETDESRSLRFSLCCLNHPNTVKLHITDTEVEAVEFESPRIFNIHEVRKLAATTDLRSSVIWANYDSQGNLFIKGLLNIGRHWSNARSALSWLRPTLPSALNIRVSGAGRLAVYLSSYLIATLDSGKIPEEATVTGLDYPGIKDFLKEGFNQLKDTVEIPGQNPSTLEWNTYLNTILALVNTIQAKGHGGALIIAKDHSEIRDNGSLNFKYSFKQNPSALKNHFLKFLPLQKQFVELWEREIVCPKNSLESNFSDPSITASRAIANEEFNYLVETVSFVGNWAGADGAVVISRSLEVIGFGVEISVGKKSDQKAFSYPNDEELQIEQRGMRFRSAVYLCDSNPEIIVFVVSQDGDVSLVWNLKDKVRVDGHVNLTNVNMVKSRSGI